jgi:hypothetical protein
MVTEVPALLFHIWRLWCNGVWNIQNSVIEEGKGQRLLWNRLEEDSDPSQAEATKSKIWWSL